jgi:hypothetical protein
MNITAYILYLFITYLITVRVGLIFYRNGEHYLFYLLHGDKKLGATINKILLAGYYLLNLGYTALMISTWKTVNSWAEVFVSVSLMTGKIMLTLALIHFLNMAVIYLFSLKHKPLKQ